MVPLQSMQRVLEHNIARSAARSMWVWTPTAGGNLQGTQPSVYDCVRVNAWMQTCSVVKMTRKSLTKHQDSWDAWQMPHNLIILCPLLQSVRSSQGEFTPYSDSMIRSLSTPSLHSAVRSTCPSSRPASPWMGLSSLSSRWDLISRGPSSALSSTTSGTSLPTYTTAIEVRQQHLSIFSHLISQKWRTILASFSKKHKKQNKPLTYDVFPSWIWRAGESVSDHTRFRDLL